MYILPEAGIIIDNKNSFWQKFIYKNFKDDKNLLALKKHF